MPVPPTVRLRAALAWGVLAAVLGFVIWQGSHLLADRSVIPPDDFVEYWAAGRLNLHGQNPYDGDLLLPLEQSAGRDTAEPVMMWNPPWTLSLAMPFGSLPPRQAQLLWLAGSLALVVGCADRLWVQYGGADALRWVAWVIALTYLPTLFVLQAGQIGPFVLLGITGFLLADRAGRPWLAGACGVLMAIKPHLVYLFWVALAGWSMARPTANRSQTIAGGLAAGLLATAVPLAVNSSVLRQYWEAMTQRPPDQWRSPTIGSYLREWLGEDRFGLQFAPTVIGLAWLAVCAWRGRHRPWDWSERLPMLLLVSFTTASYGAWPFDLVILLPAVIQVAAQIARSGSTTMVALGIVVFVCINGLALTMNALGATSDKFVWMAPSLLAAYLALRPRPVSA